MPVNTTSILQPMDQGIILIFQVLLNLVYKTTAIIDIHPLMDLSKTAENLLKRIHHSRRHQEHCDSWEEIKKSTVTRFWKRLISALIDDFEGFKMSIEEVIAIVVEIPRELGAEPD